MYGDTEWFDPTLGQGCWRGTALLNSKHSMEICCRVSSSLP